MTYFKEALDPKQLDVLGLLGEQMATWGFYLAGGTALAIYLKHRRSVDLDWFTGQSLGDAMGSGHAARGNSGFTAEFP
jgi:hypothetical protein